MSRLTVLEYPDPRLRDEAMPVLDFGPTTRQLVEDMLETLYASKAIGLAAPQVGNQLQIIVADVPGTGTAPMVFINPRITAREHWAIVEESCLSLPGLEGKVKRNLRVTVEAHDVHGIPFTRSLQDMEAIVVQHELDHLTGVLFVDRLPLWRQMAWRWRNRNLHLSDRARA